MQCFAEHSCLHVAATIWAARPLTLTQQSEMYESTGICYAQPCWEDKSQHFEEGIMINFSCLCQTHTSREYKKQQLQNQRKPLPP